MKRFLKKLFTHPGTWFLIALTLVVIATTLPVSTPVLVGMAIMGFSIGGALTLPYFYSNAKKIGKKMIFSILLFG